MATRFRALFKDYVHGLVKTPQLVRRVAFKTRTLEEQRQEALLRGNLQKAFSGTSLLLMALGFVIGNGAYGVNGSEAARIAGPASTVSYILSGVASLCAAACYGELAVELPIAGGPYTFTMVTLGELPAWLTLISLLLQYIFLTALMAQAVPVNMARMCGNTCIDAGDGVYEPEDLQFFNPGGKNVIAFGIVLLLTVLLSLGVRESVYFFNALASIKLVLLTIIVIAAFTRADGENLVPFAPQGPAPIFSGMSLLFYSFLGWDTIANAAEEVQKPVQMAWAMVGTVLISGVYYFLTAMGLNLMVPYSYINPQAAGAQPGSSLTCESGLVVPLPSSSTTLLNGTPQGGSAAFTCVGLDWAAYVSIAANIFGILSALTVSLFTVSRLVMVASRDWMLPPVLARVSTRTQTPVLAQVVAGVIIAFISLLLNYSVIMDIASLCQLIVLWVVANILIYRRYYPESKLRFTSWGGIEAVESRTLSVSVVSKTSGPGRPSSPRSNYSDDSKADQGEAKLEEQASGELPWVTPLGSSLSVRAQRALVLLHLAAITGISVALAATFVTGAPSAVTQGVLAGAWLLATSSLWLLCPVQYCPKGWHIPAFMLPWVPALAIGLVVFSMAQLSSNSALYWHTAIAYGVALVLYFLYSLPMSYIRQFRMEGGNTTAEQFQVEELVYRSGQWVPAHSRTSVFITPQASTQSTVSLYLSSSMPSDLPPSSPPSSHSKGTSPAPSLVGSAPKAAEAKDSGSRAAPAAQAPAAAAPAAAAAAAVMRQAGGPAMRAERRPPAQRGTGPLPRVREGVEMSHRTLLEPPRAPPPTRGPPQAAAAGRSPGQDSPA